MSSFAPTGPDVLQMIKRGELQTHEDKKCLKAKAYTGKLIKIRKALQKDVSKGIRPSFDGGDVRAVFQQWLLRESEEKESSNGTKTTKRKRVAEACARQIVERRWRSGCRSKYANGLMRRQRP